MKKYGAGNLQGIRESCGFACLRPWPADLGESLRIAGYLGSIFNPIDSHNCIEFLAGEFEEENSFRVSC